MQDLKYVEQRDISSLQSLMTLLKVARENMMIRICDDSQDIRLEENAQDELSLL